MILTDLMMQKISEPGLWFFKSYQPTTDIVNMVYELSVKSGVPVTVLSSCNKRIQQDIIARIRHNCIDTASNENERNWLEQEMAEYNAHGFFFHPQEMNVYVENGPFWSDYVHFDDEEWLNFSCCPYDVVLIDDIHIAEIIFNNKIISIIYMWIINTLAIYITIKANIVMIIWIYIHSFF